MNIFNRKDRAINKVVPRNCKHDNAELIERLEDAIARIEAAIKHFEQK